MKKQRYNGPERRQYFRHNLIYSPKDKAILKIGTDIYEVLDLSGKGLRIKKESGTLMEKRVSGTVEFASGETWMIDAEIIWEQENEIGLKFVSQIRRL